MAGIGGSIGLQGIDRLNAVLGRLAGVDSTRILSVLGGLVEQQTKDRIEVERKSPDGEAWPEWSPLYAATRHGNQDLLQSEGHLVDSIQSIPGFGQAEIGSNLIYAATHQFGDAKRGIPQREFMGVGQDNLFDLQYALDEWADKLILGAA